MNVRVLTVTYIQEDLGRKRFVLLMQMNCFEWNGIIVNDDAG